MSFRAAASRWAITRLRPPHELDPQVLRRLKRGCSESRARALALAAIRETFEETGLILGEAQTPTLKSRSPHWQKFLAFGFNPRLDTLEFVARAITPTGSSQRFDARFFMAEADLIRNDPSELPAPSDELLELHWVTLNKARELALPSVTRIVLDEVERRIKQPRNPAEPGPFVRYLRDQPLIAQV